MKQARRQTTSSGPSPLTVFSPAKINLYLRVVGKRPDGYHELEMVMIPLDFGDEIVLQRRETGITLECDQPDLPVDDSNLAVRAAKLLAETFGVEQGVNLVLRKRIPLAAGLGGGSSNAATVLWALDQFWGVQASAAKLHELAAKLGSDINFFLQNGAALCRGRGEQIEPISGHLPGVVLLINPGFGISTKWAYATWARAEQGGTTLRTGLVPPQAGLTPPVPDVILLRSALANGDLAAVGKCLYNSLEAASVRKFPVLRLLKDALRQHGARGALMSGSGATVFGLFDDAATAERTAASIRERFGPSMWTKVTKAME